MAKISSDFIELVSNHNKILTSFIAGVLAGAIAKTTIAPLDRTKINFKTSKVIRFSFKKAIQFLIKTYKIVGVFGGVTLLQWYSNLIVCFRNVLKEEGWKMVMRGYTPTVFGSCIYSGISFFTYETLKIMYAEYTKGVDPNPFERWCCGAVAGIVGQCSSYPLDIVRRRMHTAGVTGHAKDYTTIFKTAKIVYIHEGLKDGFYKCLS